MNLPNQLTFSRLIMACVFVVFMSFHHVACYIIALLVFSAAAITDYYDGKIARTRGLESDFGKLWDPVADKVLLTAAFIMLMGLPVLHIPAWTVVVILAREFIVTGARSLAASDGVIIGANVWGKTKAIFQMTYVIAFLLFVIIGRFIQFRFPDFADYYTLFLQRTSYWGIILVALVTVYSGIQFTRINWNNLYIGRTS